MRVAIAIAAVALPPSVQPWPIGAGPRYHPPARPAAVRAGRPVDGLRCGSQPARFVAHVELFANRRVIVVPAGIGRSGGCVYPIRTNTPTGVVRVARRGATVGELFRVWGQSLGPRRLLSFGGRRVRMYVGGRAVTGDPRSAALTPHAQIVLEVGGYVPPHPTFLFPKGTP
jgi:hypothetical protein